MPQPCTLLIVVGQLSLVLSATITDRGDSARHPLLPVAPLDHDDADAESVTLDPLSVIAHWASHDRSALRASGRCVDEAGDPMGAPFATCVVCDDEGTSSPEGHACCPERAREASEYAPQPSAPSSAEESLFLSCAALCNAETSCLAFETAAHMPQPEGAPLFLRYSTQTGCLLFDRRPAAGDGSSDSSCYSSEEQPPHTVCASELAPAVGMSADDARLDGLCLSGWQLYSAAAGALLLLLCLLTSCCKLFCCCRRRWCYSMGDLVKEDASPPKHFRSFDLSPDMPVAVNANQPAYSGVGYV